MTKDSKCMRHLPICPKCKKQVAHLLMVERGTYKEYLTIDCRGEEDSQDQERDNVTTVYFCPHCDEELFKEHSEAAAFMRQED